MPTPVRRVNNRLRDAARLNHECCSADDQQDLPTGCALNVSAFPPPTSLMLQNVHSRRLSRLQGREPYAPQTLASRADPTCTRRSLRLASNFRLTELWRSRKRKEESCVNESGWRAQFAFSTSSTRLLSRRSPRGG